MKAREIYCKCYEMLRRVFNITISRCFWTWMQVCFLGQHALPQFLSKALSNTLSPWSPSDKAVQSAQGDLNYTWDGVKKTKQFVLIPAIFLSWIRLFEIRLCLSNFTIWEGTLMPQIKSCNICSGSLGEKAGGLCFFREWFSRNVTQGVFSDINGTMIHLHHVLEI